MVIEVALTVELCLVSARDALAAELYFFSAATYPPLLEPRKLLALFQKPSWLPSRLLVDELGCCQLGSLILCLPDVLLHSPENFDEDDISLTIFPGDGLHCHASVLVGRQRLCPQSDGSPHVDFV